MACLKDQLDKILPAVLELVHRRVIKRFDGVSIAAPGSDGWWTGTWHRHEADDATDETSDDSDETDDDDVQYPHWCWGGDRHIGSGLQTVLSCKDGMHIVATTYYKVTSLGPYHKNE